jgi:PhnB protein
MTTKTATKPKAATKAKPAAKAAPKTKAANTRPEGVPRAPLSPHIVCRNAAKAIDFYKKAFGATEMMRMPGPDGRLIHASLLINGAVVMMVDEMPEHGALSPLALKGTSVTLHLNVPNVDEVFARAIKAGATPRMPVADMFWGDRYGIVTDPFGHQWSIATHQRDVSAEDMQKAIKNMSSSMSKAPRSDK